MNANTRRLVLPSGDYFELPMPVGGGRFVPRPPVLSGATAKDVVIPIVVGVAIGATVTVILIKAFD